MTVGRSLVRRFERWLFAPGSPHVLATWRAATNAWMLWYLGKRWGLITRTAAGSPHSFRPVGLARPLRRPLPVGAVKVTTGANYATAAAAALGLAYPVTGPLNAVLTWWTLTYRNSWSMVFHNDNLGVLHLAVLGAAPAADVWSADALASGRSRQPAPPSWQYGWPIRTANAVTVTSYFVSGVAKLAGPLGWRWATGQHLRCQVATDGVRKAVLRPEAQRRVRPAVAFVEARPRLWTAFAVVSLATELAAPLALVDRRLGRLWVAGAWSMHVGIKAIMDITFRYQLCGVPYLPMAMPPGPQR